MGKFADQGRCISEVKHQRAAGAERDQQPDGMLRADLGDPAHRQRSIHFLQAVATVAFYQAFHQQEEIGPDRLWTGEAAPDTSGQRVGQDQDRGRQDHQPGDVVELLRPDFDEEAVEPAVFKIEQDGLVRLARSAVPAQERRNVVDAKRED